MHTAEMSRHAPLLAELYRKARKSHARAGLTIEEIDLVRRLLGNDAFGPYNLN